MSKQLLTIDGVFDLPIDKPLKKQVMWCNVCKCKTLMSEERISDRSFWNCNRAEHQDNLDKFWDKRMIQNLDNKYQKELLDELHTKIKEK